MTRVNLLTGFLGSGKTTTLLHLLAHKPEEENWAVLVNEFGEVGIDGALLANSGAILKEIPGGCMCCVNGLPMQVGLNRLLKQNKPDRLLIEPTGLGHPRQLLQMLTSPVYQPWLELQATLTLLDARQLNDERVAKNENFRDQLAAADIIVGNKRDRWSEADRQRLEQWLAAHQDDRQFVTAEFGQIPLTLLDRPRGKARAIPHPAHHHHHSAPASGIAAMRLDGHATWRRAVNQGQGYVACGWIFDDETVFDTLPLLEWARLAPVDRVKGVLRIAEGAVSINRQGEDVHIEILGSTPPDSRVEMIHSSSADWNSLQSALLKIRLS
ncbi:GTP-binding protein [Pantoea allii]|uniref:GTP-binding protein n=1 Tax=Pantoea allii TaxID=574096 RepID=A0ABS6VDR2_9GAMM|nr:GTP-binding protein [Pantoea allii]MBW1214174.1 GTP-binding protein [Pantoea allii]MBW1257456.1 GTP-binding protein [Pantoea allii]MBW1268606.1 GTP-binding protein [Pantoea allii]MBW1290627.1 GTP-binding protein [Pantoea allii]MDJ0038054.1 GTP-binding protein [Pantoea allii]